ncbi:MAG: hypothetical protein ABI707_20220 [Ferruginibacter sp.]
MEYSIPWKKVVHFYNTWDIAGVVPGVDGNVNDKTPGKPHPIPVEEKYLVAFMKTLADDYQLQ